MRTLTKLGVPLLLAAAVAGLGGLGAACGSNDNGGDPTPMSISIEPPDAMITVVNGAAVSQDYKVLVRYTDGNFVDASGLALMRLADPQYGEFTRNKLLVGGSGAGVTKVTATVEGLTGETSLTVFVKRAVIDPGLPGDIGDKFDNATDDPALAPAIQYPADKVLVPPNLGRFDVHWTTANTNIFELRMRNQYVDIRRYSNGLIEPTRPFWTQLEPSEWFPIASTKTQLSLEVSGMNTADTTKKGTSKQVVDVTNEVTRGGVYYWATTEPDATILSYDLEKTNTVPEKLYNAGAEPGGAGTCHGCHTISKDGSRMSLTLDGNNGRGTVVNLLDRSLAVPVADATKWSYGTFTPDATKLITLSNGQLSVRASEGGAILGTIANAPGTRATHPELSPDGTLLVYAQCSGGSDAFTTGCGLVSRPFNNADNTVGDIKVLVPAGEGGKNSYYPAISPDGKWLAFTRSPSNVDSYDEPNAETWIMKVDGSAPPIQLAAADLGHAGRTNSWARWAPFAQTFGASSEPLTYLTFSSKRKYGVRLAAGTRPQIWMTPILTARAEAGQDPSGPSFRLPFQDVAIGNHIAQWTQEVVVIE
jgi:WD40-like Beta Propeller Repeat